MGTPDELYQFGQGVIVVIELQFRIVLGFGPLFQKFCAGYIKETVAQVSDAGTILVRVGGFGITGQKPAQGRVMSSVAA